MTLTFRHRLRPLPDLLALWKEGGVDPRSYLTGWFWLTDGRYAIDTPHGRVFAYHPAFVTAHDVVGEDAHFLDDQVGRLWWNLAEILPDVLDVLPTPFDAWVETGQWQAWLASVTEWWNGLDEHESDLTWNAWYEATAWWGARHLDTGYLAAGPRVVLWRVRTTVTMEWDARRRLVDGVPCWEETAGRVTLSVTEFQAEVEAFRVRLHAEMERRLREVAALGMLTRAEEADLRRQHADSFARVGRSDGTNWTTVLAAVKAVEDASGIASLQATPDLFNFDG
ncbi:DUF5984 family protein [Deinococcus yavapaiensis]|uniref:Uncharacterized protein n=1 Tax=Deinococcus yavapaiensis KR-236 TaxID=694435 RepID=A0A318SIN0_9DEIO|nr:DUF5984 family protein [Deinococcus yavapaiensis]PYE53927.1 hypothetical protein DES52_107185 [Deinococcus yavapaiensis KR-236]